MATTNEDHHPAGETRRDFLFIATGAVAAVGAGAAAWPFIDQMNPDEGAIALSTIDVDLSGLDQGESMTVMWRSKPVFIRRRTEEEVASAKDVNVADLIDPESRNPNLADGPTAPATDANRAVEGREDLLIMVGVCTHLGCIPIGQQGDFGGWFCPCHGSHYDTAGRVRVGPAPENLAIPPYTFASDGNTVTLG